MLKILFISLYVLSLSVSINNSSYAESSISEKDIVEIFKKSMKHWKINYDTLDKNKSGAACIPWEDLNKEFVNKEIFIALGYGFSLFDINIGKKAALEGCERMRRANKIEDTCDCEMILYNDEILIEIKK